MNGRQRHVSTISCTTWMWKKDECGAVCAANNMFTNSAKGRTTIEGGMINLGIWFLVLSVENLPHSSPFIKILHTQSFINFILHAQLLLDTCMLLKTFKYTTTPRSTLILFLLYWMPRKWKCPQGPCPQWFEELFLGGWTRRGSSGMVGNVHGVVFWGGG